MISINGRVIAIAMEPKETYLNLHVTIKNRETAINTEYGANNTDAPKVVLTPFPPLNFKNMLKSCPIMAANAKIKI